METGKEKIINNYEIFILCAVFLYVMYVIFPENRIVEYALNEKQNLKLVEMYLKNISDKYPEKTNISFALIELYIREKKYFKANQLIAKMRALNIKDRLIDFYSLKIKLLTIAPQNSDKEIEEIYEVLIEVFKKDDVLKNKIDFRTEILNFIENLYEIKKEKVALKFTLKFFYDSSDKLLKKQILLKHIEMLKKNNLMLNYVKSLKEFEDFALDDDRLSYEIIKFYIESNRIDMASDFSMKVMRKKKVL